MERKLVVQRGSEEKRGDYQEDEAFEGGSSEKSGSYARQGRVKLQLSDPASPEETRRKVASQGRSPPPRPAY